MSFVDPIRLRRMRDRQAWAEEPNLNQGFSERESNEGLSGDSARELRRKTLWLIAIFVAIHFAMLTARAAVVELDHQLEIAKARALLVPVNSAVFYLMYLLLRRMRGRPFVQQALAGATLSLGAALIHATIWAQFLSELDVSKYPSPASYVTYQSFYWYLYYFAWTAAYLALCYSITVREHEKQASALIAEAQSAQIRALRYQINPHFLFNTLNSIAALVTEDCRQAEAMVLNLSEFFRATLAVDPLEEVRLADEVALQELYLKIEQVRFPNRLSVALDVPEELSAALVPSLILQPLVENAVKHGVACSETPTRIAIGAEESGGRLRISVIDNAVRASATSPGNGTGVGLDNVRNRLRARYGSEGSLQAERSPAHGFSATIELPLRFAS
jgi:two-component system, LytTR family, sensor kinase